MDYLMTGLLVLGSIFTYRFVYTLAAPREKTPGLAEAGIATKVFPGAGRMPLNPQGNLLERLDFLLAKKLNLEFELDRLHMQLGRPGNMTALHILHYKEVAVALTAGFLLAFALLDILSPVAIIFSPIAFFIPDLILRGRVRTRQIEILGSFPQFVDLTALLLESGTDYMTAFEKISRVSKKKSDLDLELEKTVSEVSLGSTRKDALRHFADRIGVQELRAFVGLIIQSEELGTSLGGLLTDYATDMRFQRLNKAEKMAAQASTKMLFPLFVFIFPTVFILMLAPMVREMLVGGGLF